MPRAPLANVSTKRLRAGSRESVDDRVVVEEPLEIRLDGDTLAITMRTPGHDRELVMGFLVSEGIIASADDVSTLAHCGKAGLRSLGPSIGEKNAGEGHPAFENTMAVTLGPGAKPPVDPKTGELVRRGTLLSSACGVCGRRSLDDLFARVAPLRDATQFSSSAIGEAVAGLTKRQPVFEATGGCHAASLFAADGEPIVTFEDIGRHNAVDKVVGSQCLARTLHAPGRILVVSGRSSFEIVQKALSAGIAAVASVSAPSSLAVSLAREANMVLAGFVRGDGLVVYAGEERVS